MEEKKKKKFTLEQMESLWTRQDKVLEGHKTRLRMEDEVDEDVYPQITLLYEIQRDMKQAREEWLMNLHA
jgi:hypothetical protein